MRTQMFTSGSSASPTRKMGKSGRTGSTVIWRSRKSRAGVLPAALVLCGFLFVFLPAGFLLLLLGQGRTGIAGGFCPIGSAALNFDLLGFGLLAFRNRDFQYAVVESCAHVFRINVAGQREGAVEAPVGALDSKEVVSLFLIFQPALAADGQHVVLDPYLNVLFSDAGKLDLHHNVVVVFHYVHRRNEVSEGQRLLVTFAAAHVRALIQKLVQAVRKRKQVGKGVPTRKIGHGLLLNLNL